jgi:hypothetical protein
MAQGDGWAQDETIQGASANWAVAQGAQIFLPGQADHTLTIRALPFEHPDAAGQTMTPRVNGHALQQANLSPGWHTYSWAVPARLLQPGLNDVRLEFGRLSVPADVLPGNGIIGATGIQAVQPIEVNSGGPAGFAYITVGEQDGSAHGPGYNVAVVDPRTGNLLDRRAFDTTPHGSQAEAEALASFLAGLPNGQVVVVALQGDGAAQLTDATIAAFQSIGGQSDPRDTSGWSHAIIGAKGAAPGTALEASGQDNGWLRVAPDRRSLGIAVDVVQWEQVGGLE